MSLLNFLKQKLLIADKPDDIALRKAQEALQMAHQALERINAITYPGVFPYGIRVGENTWIAQPRQVDGAERITVGTGCYIGIMAWISAYQSYISQQFSPAIEIGNNVTIGNFLCMTSIDRIVVGDGCLFSEQVYISDHYHQTNPSGGLLSRQPLENKGPVYIGESTFIGYRACILSGVQLGKHCVVGANAVVTKSFPDYSMVAGTPAKIIKRYSLAENAWKSVDSRDDSA